MRISSIGAVGRAQFYDRNPISIALGTFSINQAPHGLTTRFTYTVPTGRKCYVGILHGMIGRETVAAPAANVELQTRITPFGGAATLVFALGFIGNTVDTERHADGGSGFVLSAAEVCAAQTADLSTGGTTSDATGFTGTEFDA
jgi:hypothetical protein